MSKVKYVFMCLLVMFGMFFQNVASAVSLMDSPTPVTIYLPLILSPEDPDCQNPSVLGIGTSADWSRIAGGGCGFLTNGVGSYAIPVGVKVTAYEAVACSPSVVPADLAHSFWRMQSGELCRGNGIPIPNPTATATSVPATETPTATPTPVPCQDPLTADGFASVSGWSRIGTAGCGWTGQLAQSITIPTNRAVDWWNGTSAVRSCVGDSVANLQVSYWFLQPGETCTAGPF